MFHRFSWKREGLFWIVWGVIRTDLLVIIGRYFSNAGSLMSALVYLSDQGQQNFVFTCRARESAIAKELDKRTAVFRLPIGTDTADQL